MRVRVGHFCAVVVVLCPSCGEASAGHTERDYYIYKRVAPGKDYPHIHYLCVWASSQRYIRRDTHLAVSSAMNRGVFFKIIPRHGSSGDTHTRM